MPPPPNTTPPTEGECAKCYAFGGWGGNATALPQPHLKPTHLTSNPKTPP